MKRYRQERGLSITRICGLLGESRQSHYRSIWSEKRHRERAEIAVKAVERARMEMPRLGGRKLYYLLHDEMRMLGVGRDRLFDILRANHMLVKPVRSYHVTTNSHHRFRKHRDIVSGMSITRPEQVWVADITYLGVRDRHMYLSLVTDAYSKKIVGHDLSESLATDGALRALARAKRARLYPEAELIHHSDRGIQYCSDSYQRRLKNYGIKVSMTESYDPYANAVAERVNGILKQEFLLEKYDLPLAQMKNMVADAIATYNYKRPHMSCNYLTPQQMHLQNEMVMKTYKKKISSRLALN